MEHVYQWQTPDPSCPVVLILRLKSEATQGEWVPHCYWRDEDCMQEYLAQGGLPIASQMIPFLEWKMQGMDDLADRYEKAKVAEAQIVHGCECLLRVPEMDMCMPEYDKAQCLMHEALARAEGRGPRPFTERYGIGTDEPDL